MRRIGRFCLAGPRLTNLDLVRYRAALLVVAVLACSTPAPAPSGSPARAVRSAPQNVILQAADVPADYMIEKDDAMSPDDLANGLGTTPPVLKQRLAFGYIRSFTKGGDPFVCCVIDSILITTACRTCRSSSSAPIRTTPTPTAEELATASKSLRAPIR